MSEELIPKEFHKIAIKNFQKIYEMSITSSILRLFRDVPTEGNEKEIRNG